MGNEIKSNNPFQPRISATPPRGEARAEAKAQEKQEKQGDSLSISPAAQQSEESLLYKLKKKAMFAVSDVRYAERSHALTEKDAEVLLQQMKPGDIMLRRVDGISANDFIPGYFGHAAVYIGEGQIIDATTHGVRQISLKDFLAEGDRLAVVRPKDMTSDKADKIIGYAKEQLGKPYDWDFDMEDGNQKFACTELAEKALQAGYGHEMAQNSWTGKIAPDGFENNNFKLLWTNVPKEIDEEALQKPVDNESILTKAKHKAQSLIDPLLGN